MSDCRLPWNREDELPVYLAGPITTGPNKRKSYGMFSSVEGAFDSKTLDFDNLAVGRKGSRTPRSGSRERILDAGDLVVDTASEARDVRDGSHACSPGDRKDGRPGVEIKPSSVRENDLGHRNGKVRGGDQLMMELISLPLAGILDMFWPTLRKV